MENNHEAGNNSDSRVRQLIDGGILQAEENPVAAIELFEEAWELAIESDLTAEQRELIPQLGRLYYVHQQDLQKMLNLHIQSMKIAEAEQDDELIAKSAMALSWIYCRTQYFTDEIEVLQKGLESANRLEDKELIASLLNNLANCQGRIGNLNQALSLYFQQLALGEEIDDAHTIRNACWNIQLAYMGMKDYHKTKEYGLRALEISEELNDQGAAAGIKINLSTVYKSFDDFKESMRLINESIETLKTIPTRGNQLTVAYLNRGLLYHDVQDYANSEIDILKAIDLAKQKDYREWLLRGYDAMGSLAMVTDRVEEATGWLNKALALARDIDQNEFYIIVYKSFSSLYKIQKDYKKQAEILMKIQEFQEKKFSEDLASSLADMQVRYDMEKKVQEAEFYRARTEDLEKMNLELQQAYDKLKQSQDAIRILERKSSIMAMAVTANHELNQPLMIIHGNLELLKSRLNLEDIQKAKYFQRIENAVHRIEGILQKYRNQGDINMINYTDTTMMFEFDELEKL